MFVNSLPTRGAVKATSVLWELCDGTAGARRSGAGGESGLGAPSGTGWYGLAQ